MNFATLSLGLLAKLTTRTNKSPTPAAILRGTLVLMLAYSSVGWANQAYNIETVAKNMNYPWSIAFLPNGDRLVAELGGTLRRITADDIVSEPISGVPEVYRASQGGLFDVMLARDFVDSRRIYLSYAEGTPQTNGTAVATALLDGNTLTDVEVIFSASPKKQGPVHYGGRMVWLPDDTLLLATGDGFDYREAAQDLSTNFGKTLRMNADGTPAAGNPFPSYPYVYTYGHRNPQGLLVTQDGAVYLHEHGPQGGDEVNLIEAGSNYGWPAATHGLDYNGAYVSPFKELPGMTAPKMVWVPSIAPSGFMIYEGELFPQWRGDLFLGALVDMEVRRIEMNNGEPGADTPVFPDISARIRDIRQAPDGSIYVLTDGTAEQPGGGAILRVVPATSGS